MTTSSGKAEVLLRSLRSLELSDRRVVAEKLTANLTRDRGHRAGLPYAHG
jgi:hypothetical protein